MLDAFAISARFMPSLRAIAKQSRISPPWQSGLLRRVRSSQMTVGVAFRCTHWLQSGLMVLPAMRSIVRRRRRCASSPWGS